MIDLGELEELFRLLKPINQLQGYFQGPDNANLPPPNERYPENGPNYPSVPDAPLLNGYQETGPYYPQPTTHGTPL